MEDNHPICSFVVFAERVIAMNSLMDMRTAADAVVRAIRECGRSEYTIWIYERAYSSFIEWCERGGVSRPGEEDCVAFLNEAYGAGLSGLYGKTECGRARAERRPLGLLVRMMEDGRVDVCRDLAVKEWSCPPSLAHAYDGYLAECANRGNATATLRSKECHVRLLVDFLGARGVGSWSALGSRDVTDFLLGFSRYKRKTMASLVSTMRDFLSFLSESGENAHDLASALPKTRVVRNESLPYLWAPDEVRALLGAVDRSSAIGKRDYAIILLVARLGLRSGDVRALSFESIDWNRRRVTVLQHKTGRPLVLPLLDDVGWAIIDYLQNGRPATDSDRVFVKHRYPFDAIGGMGSISGRLYNYAKKAGIEFPYGQSHGMHSLRSTLARAMLAGGAPMATICFRYAKSERIAE